MSKGPEETTDKLFPPPEGDGVERPLPLLPSVRQEFLAHRLHIDSELRTWRVELGAALARLAPEVTVRSTIERIKGGMLVGFRYGSVAALLGEAAAEAAKVAGHPEIEGPIRVVLKIMGVTP